MIHPNVSLKDLIKILQNRFRRQHLSTELLYLLELQASQILETEGEWLKARQDYTEKIRRNGLEVKKPEETSTKTTARRFSLPFESFTKQRYVDFIASLKAPANNQYSLLATERHVMATPIKGQKMESAGVFLMIIQAFFYIIIMMNLNPLWISTFLTLCR